MGRIHLFMMLSLDGYFEGPNHDLSWHHVDDEFNKFAIEQKRETGVILFGRRTYQLMEGYWPKAERDPKTSPDNLEIARLMNNTPKIVFSRTLDHVRPTGNWKNVELAREVEPAVISDLKKATSKDIWVSGSDLAMSFLKSNLIDEFRFMINPIMIGQGTPIFEGMGGRLNLQLTKTRKFASGNLLLYYEPAKSKMR
jgi:dihydrofolate reductase